MNVDGRDALCFLGILLLLGKFGAFLECFLFQEYLFHSKKLLNLLGSLLGIAFFGIF